MSTVRGEIERHRTGRAGQLAGLLKSGLQIETCEYSALKPTIDEIDTVLAKHYGFTDEELDFIVSYDIKYRVGTEEESDEE